MKSFLSSGCCETTQTAEKADSPETEAEKSQCFHCKHDGEVSVKTRRENTGERQTDSGGGEKQMKRETSSVNSLNASSGIQTKLQLKLFHCYFANIVCVCSHGHCSPFTGSQQCILNLCQQSWSSRAERKDPANSCHGNRGMLLLLLADAAAAASQSWM